MHTIAVHLISYTQLVRFPCTSKYQNSVAVGNVHGTERMNAPAHFSAFKLFRNSHIKYNKAKGAKSSQLLI